VLPSFLLSLREGLEAALIIGIVLGALRKFQHTRLSPIVWSGTLTAAIISAIAAFLLNNLGASLEGNAEMIFEGVTMLLAASILTWMVFWMHRQSRHIKGELEAGVRQATLQTGKKALFLLALVAVLREGIELALFLTAATLTSNAQQTLIGAVLGLAAAAVIGWVLFASAIRLNLAKFFQITGALLILFAAGLVAHSVHEFNELGWIPAIVEHVWDVNGIFSEQSTAGQILNSLFGYNGNPSLTEVFAYLGYFAAIAIGLRRAASASLPSTQEAA
jgi:high-affinity iron transporter